MITTVFRIFFDCAELNFYEPTLVTTDIMQYAYAAERNGNKLELGIGLNYFIKDTLSDEPDKLVGCFASSFGIATDGSISVEELYDLMKKSTIIFNNHINDEAEKINMPKVELTLPAIENYQEGLQGICDMFLPKAISE